MLTMSKINQKKIPVTVLQKVRLEKLSDDTFNGIHPNGINTGYTRIGYINKMPTLGERFYIDGTFSTSPVVSIIDNNTFKTTYSTYKIEYLD